jgi:hypothetical protein
MLGQNLVFTPNSGFTGFTAFPITAIDSRGEIASGFAVVQVGDAGPADFNRLGPVSAQDLFDFLESFFAGCP